MPDKPKESGVRKFANEIALPLAGLTSLCLINYFVFRKFDKHANYFRWYDLPSAPAE